MIATFREQAAREQAAEVDEPSEEDIDLSEEKVPEQYNERSTLTFEVPAEGTDRANFDLVLTPTSDD